MRKVAKLFQSLHSVSRALEGFPEDKNESVHLLVTAEKRTEDKDPEGDDDEQRDSVPELPLEEMRRGKSWIPIPWTNVTLTLLRLCQIQGSKISGPFQGCKIQRTRYLAGQAGDSYVRRDFRVQRVGSSEI